jgi:hypothetical protein
MSVTKEDHLQQAEVAQMAKESVKELLHTTKAISFDLQGILATPVLTCSKIHY